MTSLTQQNRKAWETQAYQAWVKQYGTPHDYADKLRATFPRRLRHVAPHLGAIRGKKIANPLGSNGRMAVALALAGAHVTVFDISEPNQKYALELAEAAGVSLEYVIGDFGNLDIAAYAGTFDAIVSDHGVLHYFPDLGSFVSQVVSLLKTDGKLIIHEFHPLLKKAVSVRDGQAYLAGDYFTDEIETVPVAFAPFADSPETLPTCLVRRWTLGEIVTAVAGGGFRIEALLELPEGSVSTLPGSFVLTARKEGIG